MSSQEKELLDVQGNIQFADDEDIDANENEEYVFNDETVNFEVVDDEDEFVIEEPAQVPETIDDEDSSSDEEFIDPETVTPIVQAPTVVSEPETMIEIEPVEEEITIEEMPENIVVIEEALIPEDKVIATDKQQSEDLFNQLVKNSKSLDSRILNHQKKILKNFEYLKKAYSVFDNNNNVVDAKIKGDVFKPYNRILTSSMYHPIVNEKKRTYNVIDDEEEMEEDEGLDFFFFFSRLNDLENQYKNGAKRENYSFYNHINELYNMLNAYENLDDGFSEVLNNDTEVYSNTFTKDIVSYGGNMPRLNKHKMLSSTKFADKQYVDGDTVSLGGYIQKSKNSSKFSHIYKGKHKLHELMNQNTIETINKEEINEIRIKGQLQIGDKVYLCESGDSDIIKEIKDDNTIVFDKKEVNLKDISIIPCDSFDKYNAFIFENTDYNNLSDYLDIITPSTKNILDSIDDEKIKSIIEVDEYLNKYNLSIDDITFNNVKTLLKTIERNNKKTPKYNVDYNKYNNTNSQQKRDNFTFINNKALDDLKEYYGEYPYFNKKSDTQEQRYRFIVNQSDNGSLYFKMMINKIEKILYESKYDRMNKLENKLMKLKDKSAELDGELGSFNYDNKECSSNRIVKVYYNVDDLENDNKKEVMIDEDRMKHGQTDPYVNENDKCILLNPDDSKKIYQRVSKKWILYNEAPNEDILQDESFCETNGLNLDNDNKVLKCKYSKKYKKCLSIEYLKKDKILESINASIKYNEEIYEQLRDLDQYLENQNRSIEQMKTNMELEYARKIRLENHFAKLYKQIKEDVDDLYQDFHDKIDKYMENIAKLSPQEYYKSLKKLIEKYGRRAYEDENVNNIYCVLGKKVLACRHNQFFIDYYDRLIDSEELSEKINSKYGVSHDGYVWCNNCGQQINLEEYETIEGFSGSGARIVTHEEIDTSKSTNVDSDESEYVKSIQSILFEGDVNSIKNNDNKLSIFKIINVIGEIMGIKINNNDSLNSLKQSTNACKNLIRSQESYIEAAQRKTKRKLTQKMLEQAYTNFYNRNCIIYTSAITFMILQTSIPGYNNLKNHKKCNPNLGGYPLEKENKQMGIDYMTCILDILRLSGNEWIYLKKINIKEQLMTAINLLIKDSNFQYLYEKKRLSVSKQIENREIKTNIKWVSFKPAFDPIKVTNSNISLANLKPENLELRETELVRKLLEKINELIDNSPIENAKYVPTPVDNFCCLEDVNNNNYLKYFIDKDPQIKTIYNNILKINDMKTKFKKSTLKIVNKPNPKDKIESFINVIFDDNDVNEEYIQEFFETFIEDGPYKGKKYVFDDFNKCIFTGISKDELRSQKHTKEEFEELQKYIKRMTHIELNQKTINYTSIKLSKLLDENQTLNNNEFLVDLNNKMIAKDKNVVSELNREIAIEVNTIIRIFDDKIKIDTQELKNLLMFLGDMNANLENNIRLIGDKNATTDFYTNKTNLIIMFLTNYIKVPINQIYNDYDFANTTSDNLSEYVTQKEFEFLDEYKFIEKEELQRSLLVLKSSTKNIHKLKGTNITGLLLQYIFIYIIRIIVENETSNVDLEKELEEFDDIEDLDITREIEKKQYVILKLIYALLMNIKSKQVLLEKHTKDYIQSVIEQKSENDKESNLRFIQELDRETWGTLKTMISLGMDTWKNLSSKPKNIYAPETVTEDLQLTNEETEMDIRIQAINDLGANYTDEQYNSWKEDRIKNSREDALAYAERDIMEDDDE